MPFFTPLNMFRLDLGVVANASGSGAAGATTNVDVGVIASASGVGAANAPSIALQDAPFTGLASGAGAAVGLGGRGIGTTARAAGRGNAAGVMGAEYRVLAEATGFGAGDAQSPVVKPEDSTLGTKYWQGFPGPAGYLDIPIWGQYPIDVVINPQNLRDTRGYAYLLRLTLPDETVDEEAYETLYPAASMGRSTTPDDTPPNTYVPGLLLGSTINYGVTLFAGIEPEARSSGGAGAIILLDTKGQLDHLIDRAWDGAKLEVLTGPPLAKFNTYKIVDKLTTAGILYNQRKKEIRLRDQGWKLQQANLHDETYKGTGGLEGPPELKGVDKPYGVGQVRQTLPVLIDAPRQIRQLSCSSIQGVDAIRDGGIDIPYTGIDYPTYEALAAAANVPGTIPPARFSTCLAQGLIATGSKPVLTLTADFRGDADVINGTGYPHTLAQIARRVMTGRGNLKIDDNDIDFSSLNKVEQLQPDVSGWWWGSTKTKADVLAEIFGGRLGWWSVRLNGLISFGIMDEPVGTPAVIINYPYDFSAEPEQMDTYQVPRTATYIGYAFNYTKQDASTLAGSIDAATIALYGQESLWASKASDVPLWKEPTAQTVRVQSGLAFGDAAEGEAIRQQSVMGKRRERWTVSVPLAPFSDVLGKIVEIRNFPRYGWGPSRKFYCIGMSFASGIAVKLTLWG